ncbi:MAG: hypothetical protein ABH803_00095 [Candidatus Micrarchaeota archaeon]
MVELSYASLWFLAVAFPFFVAFIYWKFKRAWESAEDELIKSALSSSIQSFILISLLLELSLVNYLFSLPIEFNYVVYGLAVVLLFFINRTLKTYSRVIDEFGFIEVAPKFRPFSFIVALSVLALSVVLVSRYLKIGFALTSLYDLILLLLFGLFSLFTLIVLFWSQKIRANLSENLLVQGFNWVLYSFTLFVFLAQMHILFLITFIKEITFFQIILLISFLFSLLIASRHFDSFSSVFSFKK